MRRVEWTSADGYRLEGLLIEPAQSGAPHPLVINARGGPSWPFRWGTIPLQASVAVEAGYAVLTPNPRGTPGRGAEFNQAIIGKPGFDELDDMFAGVDACVKEGRTTAGPVAIMGGSWAGYLTALAVAVRSDRLACAIMMFGLSNLVSFHRTSYEPRFAEYLLQQLPLGEEGVATYMRYSPLTYVTADAAPTLILHGELDDCTPLGQGLEFYNALAGGGTPVEMVVYPREGHSASNWERGHQLDLARRVAAWLEEYLGPARDAQ
jgi:dipeptidyl aminopeptidase/acylaminoacyl peptidase